MHFASIQGHSEVMKCLLDNGANVNARDFKKVGELIDIMKMNSFGRFRLLTKQLSTD